MAMQTQVMRRSLEDDDLDMDDADDIAPYENSPFNRAAKGLN